MPTRDTRIKEIIRIVEQKQENASKNVMVQNGILYSKDSHKYPHWRPVLPTDLEIPVIICTYIVGKSWHRNMHCLDCKHFSCKGPATEIRVVYFSM